MAKRLRCHKKKMGKKKSIEEETIERMQVLLVKVKDCGDELLGHVRSLGEPYAAIHSASSIGCEFFGLAMKMMAQSGSVAREYSPKELSLPVMERLAGFGLVVNRSLEFATTAGLLMESAMDKARMLKMDAIRAVEIEAEGKSDEVKSAVETQQRLAEEEVPEEADGGEEETEGD